MQRDRSTLRNEKARPRPEGGAGHGHVDSSRDVAGGVRFGVAHVEHEVAVALGRSERRDRPTNGPRLSSTMCSMFGGRGVEIAAESATNSSTVASASAALKRRSWPIVDERSSLMPAPHSEPAT